MASVVEMCNLALGQIRAGSINSLDEPSVQAQYCKLYFNTALDQVLNDITWGFAHVVEPLNQLTSAEIFGWSYVWQYPVNCLRINSLIRNIEILPIVTGGSQISARAFEGRDQLLANLPQVEYKLYNISGNKVIATIEADLRVDYRARITDMNLLTVDAKMAIVYLLASYLAIPIAGAKEGRLMRTDCLALYSAFKNESEIDAVNEQQVPQQESEFITIRGR